MVLCCDCLHDKSLEDGRAALSAWPTKNLFPVATTKAVSAGLGGKILRRRNRVVGVGVHGVDLGSLLAGMYSKAAGGGADGLR
jgi:hypothetical protein